MVSQNSPVPVSSSLCFHSVPLPFLSPTFCLSCPPPSPPLSQHLWMISRVRWRQEEDTRPALHIHLSFCSFYSLGPLAADSLCALSTFFLSSLRASSHPPSPPRTPPQFILSSPLLPFCPPTVLRLPPLLLSIPDRLSEPSVVKLTLRWTRLWLFAHAVWHSAKNAVKVMSWSIYCQDTPLLWLLQLCSGV